MDAAVWAVWYDLDKANAGEYLAWLHGEYLPQLVARPGYAWVAHYKNVASDQMRNMGLHRAQSEEAAGNQYMLLVGGTSLEALLAPSIIDQEREATGETRRHLDMRLGSQVNLFAEIMRVNGPAIHLRTPGSTPPACVQLGMFRTNSSEVQHAVGKWYIHTRLPLTAKMAGSVSSRVFTCVCGWPQFGVLYEFESVEARRIGFEPQELVIGRSALSGQGELPEYERAYPLPIHEMVHPPGSPFVGERLWPPLP